MKTFHKRHAPGQSVVLLAIMIVVLIGVVGLSVDVGNAYAEQRRVQSVTNAGAVAGLHAALKPGSTNQSIWNEVQRALAGNGVDSQSGGNQGPDYAYRVDYVLADGSVVLLGEWDGSTARMRVSSGSPPPSNLERMQVTMTETVDTYFARVVGQDTPSVMANGVACFGDYGSGVYPLGVPHILKAPTVIKNNKGQVIKTNPGHQEVLSNGQTQPINGNWVPNKVIRIPVDQANSFVPGVHISWLDWIPHNNSNKDLKAAWTPPGTLQNGFKEGEAGDASLPNIMPLGKLQLGDWIAGDPGVRASLESNMRSLINKEIILPMYDVVSSSKASYHLVNMGKFKLRQVQLNTGTKYIDLVYLGNAVTAPKSCSSETPWTPPDTRTYHVEGDVKVDRVWRTMTSSTTNTYDIVIVMDTSGSMDFDWNERQRGTSGYLGARMEDAKAVLKNFVQQYNVSPETGDPDARMALVTFSGSKNYNDLKVVTQVGWTKACADKDIPNNCGGDTKKWATIQTKVDQMVSKGGTPGPIAFETVEQLLQNKRTPAPGKKYGQIVLFATDGVFNVCGSDKGQQSCVYGNTVQPDGTLGNDIQKYWNNPSYNMISGRPVWQAQQAATRIRNSGARIFMIALTPRCLPGIPYCFDPAGLREMSSGSGYYYEADDGTALDNIYAQIREAIEYDTCVPHERQEVAAGAKVTLTKPNNPTWKRETTADGSGNFRFEDVPAGEYVVKVAPMDVRSPEDGHLRTYSRMRNGLNLSEEGQASVTINSQYPNGATVYSQGLMSLPYGPDGIPLNGCTTP